MSRVCFVGHQVDQARNGDGGVQVDLDPRPTPTLEPVVPAPWAIPDRRNADAFAIGQPEQCLGATTERRGERIGHSLHPIGFDRQRLVPGGKSLLERADTRQRGVEFRGGVIEDGVIDTLHRPAEAAGDEFRVGDDLAGRDAGLDLEGTELGVEPGASLRIIDLGRETPAKGGGIVCQPRRRAERLHVGLCLEIRRPVVRVDEAGAMLIQAQPEEQVIPRHGIRRRHHPRAAHRGNQLGHRSAGSAVSPTNGMFFLPAASTLIRRTAVFAAATSRT